MLRHNTEGRSQEELLQTRMSLRTNGNTSERLETERQEMGGRGEREMGREARGGRERKATPITKTAMHQGLITHTEVSENPARKSGPLRSEQDLAKEPQKPSRQVQ